MAQLIHFVLFFDFAILSKTLTSRDDKKTQYFPEYDADSSVNFEDDPASDVPPQLQFRTHFTKLERDLFNANASRFRVPWKTMFGKVNVNYLLHSVTHLSIDQREQTMSVVGRLCTAWNDPNLYWNPDRYNGVGVIRASMYDIWTPEFFVEDDIDGANKMQNQFVKNDIKIFADTITNKSWTISCPRFSVRVACVMDFANFPYDTHNCTFPFGVADAMHVNLISSWGFATDRNVKLRYSTARNDTKPRISDFSILNITSSILFKSPFDRGTYSTIRQQSFDIPYGCNVIVFSRYAPSYYYTLVLPSVLFGCATMLAPLLQFCQAMLLLAFNMLLLAFYMRDLITELPLHFSWPPRIVIYWVIQLIMTFGQMCRLCIERRLKKDSDRRSKLDQAWLERPLVRRLFTLDAILIEFSVLLMLFLLV